MGGCWGARGKKQWTSDAYQPSLEGGDCVITKKIKREKGIERRMFRVTHADTDKKGQQ